MLSKKDKRIEAKKNKIKAFLDVVKLNEMDKATPDRSASAAVAIGATGDNSITDRVSGSSAEGQKDGSGKPLLSGDELAKLKAELRARQKANMKKPKVFITLPEWVDKDEQTLVLEQEKTALFVLDLQHLLLFAAQNQFAAWKPRWCKVLRPTMIQRCMVIVVDDVSVEEFLAHHSSMPCLFNRFQMRVEMMSPSQYGRTITQELFDVPVSFRKIARGRYKSTEMKDIVQKSSVRIPVLLDEPNDTFSRVDLLLNLQQMIEENYPLPLSGPHLSDYTFSKDSYSQVLANSPLFAIDCEMCRTSEHSSELTRVSVVNEKLEVLYDELVKPPNPITDYLTQFSGITKKMMHGVTTTLKDAQRAISDILPPNAILCGQSMNNDLDALKMFHPYVIDTSVIYNLKGNRRDKSSLKRLAFEFLDREIQTGSKGHSPVEDAIATMELVLRKLQHGRGFGDVITGGMIYPQTTGSENEPSHTTYKEGTEVDSKQPDNDSNWEPHRSGCSQKRKAPSSSSEDESDGRESKRQEIDHSLIPLDQRKKRFFIQPGSREYECFFDQCQLYKKSSVIVGREELLSSVKDRKVSSVTVTSDKQAIRAARDNLDKHFLTVVQLNQFARKFTELMPAQDKEAVLSKIDKRIEKLLNCVDEKCLVSVLFTGRTTPVSTHHAMTGILMT